MFFVNESQRTSCNTAVNYIIRYDGIVDTGIARISLIFVQKNTVEFISLREINCMYNVYKY